MLIIAGRNLRWWKTESRDCSSRMSERGKLLKRRKNKLRTWSLPETGTSQSFYTRRTITQTSSCRSRTIDNCSGNSEKRAGRKYLQLVSMQWIRILRRKRKYYETIIRLESSKMLMSGKQLRIKRSNVCRQWSRGKHNESTRTWGGRRS